MKIRDLVELVKAPERVNYFIIAPDNLGLTIILNKVLSQVASTEDLFFLDANIITKDRARQLERETRMAPRGSSDHNIFFIYKMQDLPVESVGPLLKTVEEASFARFIFQAQDIPKKIYTLMSRSTVVRLPFLSRAAVLANMKSLQYDAKTADQLGLYDGTLAGTISNLNMKDSYLRIRGELRKGQRGLAALIQPDLGGSMCFIQASYDSMTKDEHAFLKRSDTVERRKLALILAMERVSG